MDNIEKKKENPGVKGVELFKEGSYSDAIIEFTKYLETNPDDREKKVAHYNRGMAHNFLGQHSEALLDGENCIKIDPFWAKGYKCKGLALEGMGKPRDAIDTLLNGHKMSKDENATEILNPLIKRLNKLTGFLKEDLDLCERMEKEKYCAVCNLFENDIKDQAMGKNTKFVSCDKCEMIMYCSMKHKKENFAIHREVCGQLLKIKKQSEQVSRVHIMWKGIEDDSIFLMAQEIKGPLGKKFSELAKFAPVSGKEKEAIDDLKDLEGYTPIQSFRGFAPVSKKECEALKTWEDWFSLPDNKKMCEQINMMGNMTKMLQMRLSPGSCFGDLINDAKEALSEALTDPMTVFFVMKKAELMANLGGKAVRIHVVGAEPLKEFIQIKAFLNLLRSILGSELRIVLIGPLMGSSPVTKEADPLLTTFGGTYQDFLLSGNYQRPDCIVAFYPGLYDGTYNWTPAVAHAIAKNVPFLVTCSDKKDYFDTKEWLKNGSGMMPKIAVDCLNPFASMKIVQNPPGSNSLYSRNMFCLLLMGGQLGGLGNLLGKLPMEIAGRVAGMESVAEMTKLKVNGML